AGGAPSQAARHLGRALSVPERPETESATPAQTDPGPEAAGDPAPAGPRSAAAKSAVPGGAAAKGATAGGGIGTGPGKLLVTLYGIFTVGAASRSIVQLVTRFDEAPLAYLLSALAALVYAFITVALVRGGEGARRVALVCCGVELLRVLGVGTWTLVEPSAFPDATVWSDYGMGYLFIPVLLPVAGLLWLRRARSGPVGGPAVGDSTTAP